jgi:hypothetical protein
MVFKSCELESSAEAGGGIRFWVIDASKIAGETVSKIKLSFDAHPQNLLVSRQPGRLREER